MAERIRRGSVLISNLGRIVLNITSDFRSRFVRLLSYPHFREFGSATALSILEAVTNYSGVKALDAKGTVASKLSPTYHLASDANNSYQQR